MRRIIPRSSRPVQRRPLKREAGSVDSLVARGGTLRRSLPFVLGLAVLLAALTPTASADPLGDQVGHATQTRTVALARLRAVERQAAAADLVLQKAANELDGIAQSVTAAYRQRYVIQIRLAEAQRTLDAQASAAYEAGPGWGIELFLGSRSASDYASLHEYAARSLSVSAEAVQQVNDLKGSLDTLAGQLERRQTDAIARYQQVRAEADRVSAQLQAAHAEASAAGLALKTLLKQQAAVDAARKRAQNAINLIGHGYGKDQSGLLALLGPTAGRGCTIPAGLVATGQQVSGLASWYGPGFAGRPTASGAIFDPNLFTAANKELPLGVFLRVNFNGKCAVVLVNDRGPYKPGRVIDLSQAAGAYLGVGLNQVTADVLVPR
jgi:rare lipoprotein A